MSEPIDREQVIETLKMLAERLRGVSIVVVSATQRTAETKWVEDYREHLAEAARLLRAHDALRWKIHEAAAMARGDLASRNLADVDERILAIQVLTRKPTL